MKLVSSVKKGDGFKPLTILLMGLSHLQCKTKHTLIYQSLTTTPVVQIVRLSVNRHYRLMKTCCVRSKRRDQYQSDNPETNDETKPFIHIIHHD